MRNLKLNLCYDGSRYKGWQRLSNEENTIQGKLEACLSRILEEPILISGSGRTDAGAHALSQIANFHCENPMAPEEILEKLRRYLPGDIGVYSCTEAGPRFHARLNAVSKTYLYRVRTSPEPCVFERNFVYALPVSLDVAAMERAIPYLLGSHDFLSFCSNKHMKKSTVREIYSLEIRKTPEELQFIVTGDGFLYNMVRILVGTLLEIGQGLRRPEDIPGIFAAKDRSKAGATVPAQGLFLMEVHYQ